MRGELDSACPINGACGLNRDLQGWWATLAQRPGGGQLLIDHVARHDLIRQTFTNGPVLFSTPPACAGVLGPSPFHDTSTDGDYYRTAGGYSDTSLTKFNPGSNPFSVSFWLRRHTGGTDWAGMVFGKRTSGGTYTQWSCWIGDLTPAFGINNGNYVSMLTYDNGNGYGIETPTAVCADGLWHHIVFTRNPWAVYVDGEVVTGMTVSTGSGDTSVAPNVALASMRTSDGSTEGGTAAGCSINDIRYWNRALSAGDAVGLYLDAIRGYPNALNWITPPGRGTSVIAGELTLALQAGLTVQAVMDAPGSITLTAAAGVALSAGLSSSADLTLPLSQSVGLDAIAQVQAAITAAHTLACTSSALATLLAGCTLDQVQAAVVDGSRTLDAVVTLPVTATAGLDAHANRAAALELAEGLAITMIGQALTSAGLSLSQVASLTVSFLSNVETPICRTVTVRASARLVMPSESRVIVVTREDRMGKADCCCD